MLGLGQRVHVRGLLPAVAGPAGLPVVMAILTRLVVSAVVVAGLVMAAVVLAAAAAATATAAAVARAAVRKRDRSAAGQCRHGQDGHHHSQDLSHVKRSFVGRPLQRVTRERPARHAPP